MATGIVKFFNDQKGFGFISRDGEDDLFVHFSNIEGTGRRTLYDDQKVEFEVGEGARAPRPSTCASSTDDATSATKRRLPRISLSCAGRWRWRST